MAFGTHLAKSPARSVRTDPEPEFGPALAFAGTLLAAPVIVLASAHAYGTDVMLPAMSSTFFALAALVAVLAWRRPAKTRQFHYWDVAGLLTLLGIFASAAVEPEQMVQLVAGSDR